MNVDHFPRVSPWVFRHIIPIIEFHKYHHPINVANPISQTIPVYTLWYINIDPGR